ncbi:FkbM family methyltransferase [Blastochloris sulfoviridis]|nr:FkbM family methyltransferase [Blastochloris sulfoviridis]
MFTKMTHQQRARWTLSWLYRLVVNALDSTPNGRFLLLTPPVLDRQVILDRRTGATISVHIRDLIDHRVAKQIFADHDYAIEKSCRMKEMGDYYDRIRKAGKIPLIIDCGGNIGMATRYFCEMFRDAAIVCIEPDASNIAMARRNNPCDRVSFLHAAIGSVDSKARMSDPGTGNWGLRVEHAEDGDIPIVSMRTVLETYDSAKYTPFIIKVDIEGFERDLFAQDTDWMDDVPLLVIELHDWLLPGQATSNNFLREVAKRRRDVNFNSENVFCVSNTLL